MQFVVFMVSGSLSRRLIARNRSSTKSAIDPIVTMHHAAMPKANSNSTMYTLANEPAIMTLPSNSFGTGTFIAATRCWMKRWSHPNALRFLCDNSRLKKRAISHVLGTINPKSSTNGLQTQNARPIANTDIMLAISDSVRQAIAAIASSTVSGSAPTLRFSRWRRFVYKGNAVIIVMQGETNATVNTCRSHTGENT